MSSRKAPALDIGIHAVLWACWLSSLTVGARAADIADAFGRPSPKVPTVVITPSEDALLTDVALSGARHILNQGVIRGPGTFAGSLENEGFINTGESPRDGNLNFDVSPKSIHQISSASTLPWLQYGRVNPTESITVNGDFHQSTNGNIYFAITPNGNSQLQVNGKEIELNGILSIHFEGMDSPVKGPIRPTYTLINPTDPSAQRIPGNPEILVAGDTGQWHYRVTETSSGQLFLTLDPVKYFQREAGSLNQYILGKLLDHDIPTATGPLYNALNTLYHLPKAQLQDTLTRIDGELHAETPGILYSAVADAWNPVYARMGMSASQGGPLPKGDPHYWMSGLGSFGGVEGNQNATGYHQQSAGALIGADTQILDLMTVGLTAGYLSAGASRTGIDNQLSANLWQIGTYAHMPLGETGHFGLLIGYDQGGTGTQNASLLGLSKSSGEARLITAEALTSWRYDFGGVTA